MVVTAATAFDVPQLLLPSARIVRPTHHDDGGDVTEGWGIFWLMRRPRCVSTLCMHAVGIVCAAVVATVATTNAAAAAAAAAAGLPGNRTQAPKISSSSSSSAAAA